MVVILSHIGLNYTASSSPHLLAKHLQLMITLRNFIEYIEGSFPRIPRPYGAVLKRH